MAKIPPYHLKHVTQPNRASGVLQDISTYVTKFTTLTLLALAVHSLQIAADHVLSWVLAEFVGHGLQMYFF